MTFVLPVESKNGEEVLFDFNLAAKRGEFAEKDEEYDKPLAAALRDAPIGFSGAIEVIHSGARP